MESAEETRKDVLSPTPQIVAPQNQQNTTTQNAVMQNPVVQNLVTQNPVMQNSVAQSPVNQPQDAKEDTPAEKVPIEKKVESEGEDTKLVRYNMCKYCQGIINKKATSQVKFCSKSCAEMFKMVPPDISAETGKIETKLSFTKREKDWKYYKELLRERSPPPPTFSQITEPAPGLEPGMKLEVLDILNPQNYCVATVTKIMGHRLCIRYDGFGDDATNDIWFNFQAEELYPIGWCASHGYSLQPPTGITSTAQEWKAFLAKTLCGALAAPSTLFKKSQIRRQLRCHSYCSGDRLEVIHPKAPHLVCPATVTKSLGPYYFFVTTDLLPGVPSHTFYGYADCPGVYHTGWCEKFGLFLDMSDPKDIKMGKLPGKPFIQTDYSNSARKNRPGLFRVPQKVEALDGEDFRVGTVAEIFGRLNMLVFDGTGQVKFFDKNSTDVFPIGWCERTESILVTPYGKVNFMSPALQKKRSSIVIQSASFKSVQNQNEKELVSPKEVASPYDSQKDDLSDGSVDGGDTDFDMSLSPNTDQQKNEMERFVVWLLNHYQYNKNEAVCVVKQELVEKFINLSNLKLSPKWFALIYKLFPGVQTVRRCVEGKFVNCLKNLEENTILNVSNPVYFKDAVEFLKSQNLQVLIDSERLVVIIGLGKNPHIPEDTKEIFMTGKSKPNSSVLTIIADVSQLNFSLSNYIFYFEENACSPPLQNITNFGEFRTSILICKLAQICRGVEILPREDNTIPNFRQGKIVKNGRLYSASCNTLAYPHKGSVCLHCKSIRYHQRNTSGQISPPDSPDMTSPHDDLKEDGICSVSSSKDDTILANLRFYFNKTCYAGVLLDPARVSQLPIKSHEEKPAQALKELIQKLMDISTDQLKFIDLLEFAFGSRIYDRGSAKIVKKGLFRFNTRNKVRKFLKRLNKRLQCCKYFIGIDLTPCKSKCKGNNITLTHSSGISLAEKLRSQLATTSAPMAQSMPANISSSYPVSISPQYQHLRKSPKKPPIYQPKIQQQPPLYLQQSQQQHQQQPQSPNVIRPSSNMQLLYQLPPSKPNSSNPQIIVQTPEGNRFSQPTQFLLPPNITSTSTSVTYMVVTKENVVQNIHVPISTQSAINAQSNAHVTHVTPNSFSSPSSGVTQMMANVAKTSLMTDIDDPNRTGKTSITIVKGNGPSNQKIFIKKPEQLYVRDNSNINKPVSISLNSPLNKSPNYIENNSQMHYPKIQYVKSLNENHSQQPTDLKRPVVQTADKNQQKHVHKLHHGNARVKYVEFKPLQNQVDNPGYKPQHLKQTIYYPSHLPGPQNTPNSQNLTIHTPVSNQNLPQQSPPALRPPPPVRPRTLALNSPPSLVASPELRPRFNFAGQPVNSTPISQISSHPVGKGNVNYKVTLGDGSLKPSRVIYQQGMSQNQNIVKPGETIQLGEQMDNRAKSNTASAQGSTAVTVTMAYIPIQTQSKDKYVYVPVNSLQPGTPNGQQILFYPQNQQVKDPNGKPVILSPQFVPTNNKPLVSTPKPDKEDNTANPYTTVRIQGVPQPGSNITNKPNTPLNLQPKTYKYQFTGTIGGMNPTLQETSRKYPEAFRMIKNDNNYRDAIKDPNDMLKAEKLEEIKEALSKELRAKENSISEKSKTENELVNDDNAKDNDEVFLHKNADKQEKEEVVEKSNENEENITPPPPRKRKRRGRPPSSSKSPDKDNARSKLSIIQENPLPPSTQGNPITLANRVLTETFYNKQKEIQKRTRFIEDPLTKCPDLPKNPENWTQDHVHAFMRGTDLAQYADTLKEEEVDGRSFLLLTREALMEFTGMRLGPALKISGYAAGLRARQRMFGIDCALYNGDDQGQSQTKTRKRSLSEKKSIKNNTIGTTKKHQTKLGNRTKVDNEIKQEITYNDGESNLIKNNPVVPMDVE